MARPKKDTALRRSHPVMLRFTDAEYARLLSHAKAANLPLAEYLRRQVTGKKVMVKYEIVADLPELKKLIAEFGKIGSNLNKSFPDRRTIENSDLCANSPKKL